MRAHQFITPFRPSVLRTLGILAGTVCVAFGLTIAIAARNGVEGEIQGVIDSIGSNLYRIRGPEGRVIDGTVTEGSIPFAQATVDQLQARKGIANVAAQTTGLDMMRQASYLGVTANYFDVHHLPMHAGRGFAPGETGVCVLSHAYAAAAFGEENPIGQFLEVRSGPPRDPILRHYVVVGILEPMPLKLNNPWLWTAAWHTDVLLPVDDMCSLHGSSLGSQDCATAPFSLLWVRVDPEHPKEGLESILAVLGDDADIDSIRTLYGFTYRLPRRIVALYALAALALLFVGGVSLFASNLMDVARETPSIGIHRALGAARWLVSARVLLRLAALALAGIVLGTALAFWLAPVFSRWLAIRLEFAATNLAGNACLVAAVLLAGLVPAERASNVPPLRAIRSVPLRFERSPLRGIGWLVTLASVVGIASVVFVASLSGSLETALRDLYGDMEPNVVAVKGNLSGGPDLEPFDLSRADVEEILALPGVLSISGELHVVLSEALYQGDPVMGRLTRVRMFGESFIAGRLISGRLPTANERQSGRPVALVGSYVADRGLNGESPLGQELVINGQPFEIIGVFDSPKLSFQTSTPEWKIIVPANSLEDSNEDRYLAWVRMDPTFDVEETLDAIRQVLVTRHPGSSPPLVEGPATEMGRMISVANGITYGLLRLGFLTLIVSASALGHLFWNQTQRKQHRISLERALGASAGHAFWSVFRTSLCVTSLAGALASVLGVIGVLPIQNWFSYWTSFRFNPLWLAWAFGAVLLAAVVGGGIPALWAARISPMEGFRKGRF